MSKGADHVARQFRRVHGSEATAPSAAGRRVGRLDVFEPRPRPGDDRLAGDVGRGARNRPGDVAKVQRLLSASGDYAFAAPRERSGTAGEPLFRAIEAYQARTGLTRDGRIAPAGETAARLASVTAYRPLAEMQSPVGDVAEIRVSGQSGRRDEAHQDTPGTAADRSDAIEEECRRLRVRAEVLRTNISELEARVTKDKKAVAQLERKIQRLETGSPENLQELIVDMLFDLGAQMGGRIGKFADLAREAVSEKHRRTALKLAKKKLTFLRKEIRRNEKQIQNWNIALQSVENKIDEICQSGSDNSDSKISASSVL